MIHLTNLNSAKMIDQFNRGDSADEIDEIVLTEESDHNIVIFNNNFDGNSIEIPEIETCDIMLDQTAR